MQNSGGDLFEADFSGSVLVGDSVQYRIKAIDASASHNVTYDPSAGYHAFAIVDRIPIGIWEPDPTPITSVPLINYLDSLGINYEYHTGYPDYNYYNCMFICLGVYSNNYQLTTQQANDLVTYLNGGGKCYMEGADAWCYDASGTIYRDEFGISQVDDGGTMSGTIDGETGTFTEGLSYSYAGENNYIDRIAPVVPAFTIFTNGGYNRTVAYDAGTYKTIGSCFELGGLTDGSHPNTKDYLIEQILTFFGIIPGVAEHDVSPAPVTASMVFPNPARKLMTFVVHLRAESHITIEIYNAIGQQVYTVTEEPLPAGIHEIPWNFRDERNRELAQGAYFYRIATSFGTETGKVLLIK
jgi:hypothetical protein